MAAATVPEAAEIDADEDGGVACDAEVDAFRRARSGPHHRARLPRPGMLSRAPRTKQQRASLCAVLTAPRPMAGGSADGGLELRRAMSTPADGRLARKTSYQVAAKVGKHFSKRTCAPSSVIRTRVLI
eukprot:SAG25_NODE_1900_length_2169_cov_1.714010_4_plen_128_part_00